MLKSDVIGLALATALWTSAPHAETLTPSPLPVGGVESLAACDVKELKKSQGLRIYSHDSARYLINKEDEKGTSQVYIANAGSTDLSCVTCAERPGGPKAERFKMQPHWHPSGRWIILAVERDTLNAPPLLRWNRDYIEGQLQNGLWTNMFAVSPDGQKWHQLSDFTGGSGNPDGFTGVAFTPDGKKGVWSQIVDGNVLFYWPFGKWELTLADFEEVDGIPRFTNKTNITPSGMAWNEPGNFRPDNETLVFTGSTEKDAQGMDQYVMNIKTRQLTNLTNSPKVWDEHGQFSPNGAKIVFMSAHPYRSNPDASKFVSIKTEFMLMNRDGSGLTQLTHFLEPGHPDFGKNGDAIAGNSRWSPDGRSISLRTLKFPNNIDWEIVFEGPCGGGTAPAAPVNVKVKSP